MSNQKITLFGVVRLKVKNSPEYLNTFTREAYSVFDSESAIDMVGKMFSNDLSKNKVLPSIDFLKKTQQLSERYRLTGGTILQFLDGMATFEIKDKHSVINDIVAEITLEDGIVKSIDSPKYQLRPTVNSK